MGIEVSVSTRQGSRAWLNTSDLQGAEDTNDLNNIGNNGDSEGVGNLDGAEEGGGIGEDELNTVDLLADKDTECTEELEAKPSSVRVF